MIVCKLRAALPRHVEHQFFSRQQREKDTFLPFSPFLFRKKFKTVVQLSNRVALPSLLSCSWYVRQFWVGYWIRITLWVGVNIGLMFSILSLTVIVLSRFVRCSTVSFFIEICANSIVWDFGDVHYWFGGRLVSLLQRHTLGGLCLLRGSR